jgi:hypothetical protein
MFNEYPFTRTNAKDYHSLSVDSVMVDFGEAD